MKTRPIGVFDSGVGGLTIVKHLRALLPNEQFIYLADHKNCPYGRKEEEEIIEFAGKVIAYFDKIKVKAIVIACNTVSNFVDILKELTTIPIIDVISPTYQEALRVSKNRNIGLIATTATVKKGYYRHLINSNKAICYSVMCDDFVSLVEGNILYSTTAETIVRETLLPLLEDEIDTLIYGCTHFEILDHFIKKTLGSLNYVTSGNLTAQALKQLLVNNHWLNEINERQPLMILTTDTKERFQKVTSWFEDEYELNEVNLDE